METRNYIFEPTCLETKIDSYNQIDAKQRQEQVLEVLGDEMLTAKEIAVKMYEKGYTTNDERNNSAPRINELMNLDLIEVCGKKTCEYTGKTVAIFKKKSLDYKQKYEELSSAYENLKNIEAFTRTRIKELKKENESLRKELNKRL